MPNRLPDLKFVSVPFLVRLLEQVGGPEVMTLMGTSDYVQQLSSEFGVAHSESLWWRAASIAQTVGDSTPIEILLAGPSIKHRASGESAGERSSCGSACLIFASRIDGVNLKGNDREVVCLYR